MNIGEKNLLQLITSERRIVESFQKLRNDEEFCDVTLVSGEGIKIKAHKVILASLSAEFENMLRNEDHKQHALLYLRGVKYSHIVYLLDFIYNGQVSIDQNELDAFLSLTKDFKIKGSDEEVKENSEDDTNNYNISVESTNVINNKTKKRRKESIINDKIMETYAEPNAMSPDHDHKVINTKRSVLDVPMPPEQVNQKINNQNKKIGVIKIRRMETITNDKTAGMKESVANFNETSPDHDQQVMDPQEARDGIKLEISGDGFELEETIIDDKSIEMIDSFAQLDKTKYDKNQQLMESQGVNTQQVRNGIKLEITRDCSGLEVPRPPELLSQRNDSQNKNKREETIINEKMIETEESVDDPDEISPDHDQQIMDLKEVNTQQGTNRILLLGISQDCSELEVPRPPVKFNQKPVRYPTVTTNLATKNLTLEQREHIIQECVEDRVSPADLARKWNCNPDTIRTWVRKAGKNLPRTYKKNGWKYDVVQETWKLDTALMSVNTK